jgi:hypothetical protein
VQLWIWRGIRVELPEDWEMLQFSRDPRAGRCAWADRYQFRAELSWQQVSGPPDLERLASDYLAKARLDGTMPDAAPARVGEWHGLRGHEGQRLTSRLSRYLAPVAGGGDCLKAGLRTEDRLKAGLQTQDCLKAGLQTEGCLVELVLLWPGELDASLEASILGSVGAEPAWPGGLRRWRAFGLDLLAQGGLDLVECSVQPARARLAFRDARGRRSEAFERLGMVRQWLRGSVRDWLAAQMPDGVPPARQEASEADGHAVECVVGVRRGGIVRAPARYEAAAWLCPADGRLYCVSVAGAEPCDGAGLLGERLLCCAERRRK